jgi:putative flippase GtrA
MEPDRNRAAVLQFVRYGISGGAATAVHLTIFYAMAIWILPALSADDPMIRLLGVSAPDLLSDAVRAKRAAVDTAVAFILSNLTAYILNVLWVFKRGRHHWALEILMFYLVSGVSLLIGTGMQTWLIAHMGLTTTVAFGTNLITSLAINFAMRKFVIFKG